MPQLRKAHSAGPGITPGTVGQTMDTQYDVDDLEDLLETYNEPINGTYNKLHAVRSATTLNPKPGRAPKG
eukprot:3103317-Pyramimonas_sp.AAC.1